jgi:DNA polymerase
MHLIRLAEQDDFDGWRAAARSLALNEIGPDAVVWQVGDQSEDLLAAAGTAPLPPAPEGAAFSVPRAFVGLAEDVILHADPARFGLLYALLSRLRQERGLMEDATDPLLRRLHGMAREVRRDVHKMRAYVRFREVAEDDTARFVAWYEPLHHIVRFNAAFFLNRFAGMRWSILTPELSIHWDGHSLAEAPGATRADAPDGDPLEETWKTYYASVFNPARLKVGAMLKEMPKRYWKNMPETALVPELIAGARARELAMVETSRNEIGANAGAAWEALRQEAMGCTRCPLYKDATQTVFGEGPVDAPFMFVGEQPGDQEDLAGKPFVGPAGQVFNQALDEAEIDRARVYVTNAVKHFKFEQRGKRRIHSKPSGAEIETCRWWVEQERDLIRPAVTVALGASAARSMLGKTVTISAARGQPHALDGGGEGWVTVHPSYLLRLPDKAAADREFARFVDDLRQAKARVAALTG